MQINKPDNIILGIDGSNLDPAKTGPRPKRPENDSADTALRTEYSSVINKALNTENVDLLAVQQAQQALAAGEIDDPNAAKIAADNILAQGI